MAERFGHEKRIVYQKGMRFAPTLKPCLKRHTPIVTKQKASPMPYTSALIGASKPQQIDDGVGALANLSFSAEERAAIDAVLAAVG